LSPSPCWPCRFGSLARTACRRVGCWCSALAHSRCRSGRRAGQLWADARFRATLCQRLNCAAGCRPTCAPWWRAHPADVARGHRGAGRAPGDSSPRKSDGELHFALLSDWRDAPSGMPRATANCWRRRERASTAEPDLRTRAAGARFLLLHRRRVWNEGEGCWIGWERKRGKLGELNRFLRGAEDTTFLDPAEPPANVRYVITLDADTRLPREAVAG